MFIQVRNLEHLKSLTFEESKDFILALEHGMFTRRIISYDADSDMFFVDDMCTGYVSEYTIAQLTEETNIVRAIQRGAFYMEAESRKLGIGTIGEATRFAEKSGKSIGVILDDTSNMCFCAPYEEYVSSMELSTYELLYVVHPDGGIE